MPLREPGADLGLAVLRVAAGQGRPAGPRPRTGRRRREPERASPARAACGALPRRRAATEPRSGRRRPPPCRAPRRRGRPGSPAPSTAPRPGPAARTPAGPAWCRPRRRTRRTALPSGPGRRPCTGRSQARPGPRRRAPPRARPPRRPAPARCRRRRECHLKRGRRPRTECRLKRGRRRRRGCRPGARHRAAARCAASGWRLRPAAPRPPRPMSVRARPRQRRARPGRSRGLRGARPRRLPRRFTQRARSRAARSSGATRAAAASSSRGASRTGGSRGSVPPPSPPAARCAAVSSRAASGPAPRFPFSGPPQDSCPTSASSAGRRGLDLALGFLRVVATHAPYGLRSRSQSSSAGSSCSRTTPESLRAVRIACAARSAARERGPAAPVDPDQHPHRRRFALFLVGAAVRRRNRPEHLRRPRAARPRRRRRCTARLGPGQRGQPDRRRKPELAPLRQLALGVRHRIPAHQCLDRSERRRRRRPRPSRRRPRVPRPHQRSGVEPAAQRLLGRAQAGPAEQGPAVEQHRGRVASRRRAALLPGVATMTAGSPPTSAITSAPPEVRTDAAGNARPSSSAVRPAPMTSARRPACPHSGTARSPRSCRTSRICAAAPAAGQRQRSAARRAAGPRAAAFARDGDHVARGGAPGTGPARWRAPRARCAGPGPACAPSERPRPGPAPRHHRPR